MMKALTALIAVYALTQALEPAAAKIASSTHVIERAL